MGKPSRNRRVDRVTGRAEKTPAGHRANQAPHPASLTLVEQRPRGGRIGNFSHYPGPHSTPQASRVAPLVATAPWLLGFPRTELDEQGARHLVRTDADEAREARRAVAREAQRERNTYAHQKRREANKLRDERMGGFMTTLVGKTTRAVRRTFGRGRR